MGRILDKIRIWTLFLLIVTQIAILNAEEIRKIFRNHKYSNDWPSVTALLSTNDPGMKKPIFLIEGFDINHKYDGEFTLDSIEVMLQKSTYKGTSFKQYCLDKGYSIFMVDLDDNWDDIYKQAYALGDLLNYIYTNKEGNVPLKVIGFSMGGVLVSATTGIKKYYELNPSAPKESWETSILGAWNFKIDLTVAWDAPHSGAYVPPSVTYFFDFWHDKVEGPNYPLQCLNAVNSTSARQLFLSDDEVRANFSSKYMQIINSIPQMKGHRFVSIINGSWNGMLLNTNYQNGDLLNWYHYEGNNFKGGIAESILSPGPIAWCFYSRLQGWFFWSTAFKYERRVSVPNRHDKRYLLGNAPGGYSNTFKLIDEGIRKEGKAAPTLYQQYHCFVPTFSAAALDYETFCPSNMWNLSSLEQTMGPMENYSPFDKIYHHNGANQAHVRPFNSENTGWVLEEVDKAMKGPDISPIINLLLSE